MADIRIRIVSEKALDDLVRDMRDSPKKFLADAEKIIAIIAKEFVYLLVSGIESGGSGWDELSDVTKVIKGGDRKLIDSGSFIGALKAWKDGASWMAGIPDGATGDKGQDLETVGAVHEEGAAIPATDKVRGFFAAKGFPLRADTKFIIVPPRPWFGPAADDLDEMIENAILNMIDDFLEGLG